MAISILEREDIPPLGTPNDRIPSMAYFSELFIDTVRINPEEPRKITSTNNVGAPVIITIDDSNLEQTKIEIQSADYVRRITITEVFLTALYEVNDRHSTDLNIPFRKGQVTLFFWGDSAKPRNGDETKKFPTLGTAPFRRLSQAVNITQGANKEANFEYIKEALGELKDMLGRADIEKNPRLIRA